MKLLYSKTSPFARKVLLAASTRGIDSQIELVPTNPYALPPELVAANPLSKIPCLITEDGEALFDSPVICEYLDSLGDAPPLFPEHGARWPALRLQALADGMMDAAVLTRMEQQRPAEEARGAEIARQMAGVSRTLAYCEDHIPAPLHHDIGTISLVCALGYLDFRFAPLAWRDSHPRLAQWFAETTAALPGFTETTPPG
ncbi:glutathione S-transferase N-terminal domain-containing protein [Acidisoma sp. C75]